MRKQSKEWNGFVPMFVLLPHLSALKILHEYIPATVSNEIQGMDFLWKVHGESVWLDGQQGHIEGGNQSNRNFVIILRKYLTRYMDSHCKHNTFGLDFNIKTIF